MVECVTTDSLHVLTRLIVYEYVYLPVDLAVRLCACVRVILSVCSSRGKMNNVQITCKSAHARNICKVFFKKKME